MHNAVFCARNPAPSKSSAGGGGCAFYSTVPIDSRHLHARYTSRRGRPREGPAPPDSVPYVHLLSIGLLRHKPHSGYALTPERLLGTIVSRGTQALSKLQSSAGFGERAGALKLSNI